MASDVDLGGIETGREAAYDGLDVYDPRKLFLLWESRQWSVAALDFDGDHIAWQDLHETDRLALTDALAPFFCGEDRVAAALPALIASAEEEAEATFLGSQLADEARHTLFFERCWRDVFEVEVVRDQTPVEAARQLCNPAFSDLFDDRLVAASKDLLGNPHNVELKIELIVVCHLLIEGLLGLTGLHFVTDYFSRRPGFASVTQGLRNVARDEHRHVAWGTGYLRKKCRESDRNGEIVTRTMMELLPVAASVMVESGEAACDGLDSCDFLDYPSGQLNHYALQHLAQRMSVIGGATEQVRHFASSGAWRAARL